jgi:hypothetical protein
VTDQYILSIDPGKSSGVALIGYNDSDVWLGRARQVEGGVSALVRWTARGVLPLRLVNSGIYGVLGGINYHAGNLTVISEKFTPLSGGGFNQTLDSVEPLRGEGALIALGLMPDYPDPKWRRPDRQYLYGGANLAEKKRRAHRFLKDSGFYVTGKDVGCKDANDARSAMLHGLSFLAQVVKHKPTYDLISNWTERN